MSDADAMLAAILARPRDDTPREVYADWLDDHGDPARAELIRVQCELANTPEAIRGPVGDAYPNGRHTELRRRETHLWANGFGGLSVAPPLTSIALAMVHDPAPGEAIGIVSRGFVGELRVASLGVLLGGVCGRCAGHGQWYTTHPDDSGECPVCDGTGRTPGLAAAVFARHPVTRVVVADREPVRFEGRVMWHNAGHRLTSSGYAGDERPADHLPACVFGRLGGFAKQPGRLAEMVRSYPTRAAALDALSHALVDHCRGLVGLPPVYGPGATTGAVDYGGCDV